jgi:antitoxin FitA
MLSKCCHEEGAMATLTIRNLDEELMENLRKQAKRHDRSVEAEVRQILKQNVRPKLSPEEFQALARRIRAMTPRGVEQPDSVELIREARARRTAVLLGEDPETFDPYEPDFRKKPK